MEHVQKIFTLMYYSKFMVLYILWEEYVFLRLISCKSSDVNTTQETRISHVKYILLYQDNITGLTGENIQVNFKLSNTTPGAPLLEYLKSCVADAQLIDQQVFYDTITYIVPGSMVFCVLMKHHGALTIKSRSARSKKMKASESARWTSRRSGSLYSLEYNLRLFLNGVGVDEALKEVQIYKKEIA